MNEGPKNLRLRRRRHCRRSGRRRRVISATSVKTPEHFLPLPALFAGLEEAVGRRERGRRLILAEEGVGDSVNAAPRPRRSAVAAVEELHVAHGRSHAAGSALRVAVQRGARALEEACVREMR